LHRASYDGDLFFWLVAVLSVRRSPAWAWSLTLPKARRQEHMEWDYHPSFAILSAISRSPCGSTTPHLSTHASHTRTGSKMP